jgi:hypothetical protein
LALAALFPVPAPAAPANTLNELWAELGSCLRSTGANEGVELTIVFSIKRSGALLGKPRIAYAKLPGDPDAQRRIAESVALAMDHCLPLSITDALGGAIAGRPMAIRLGRKRDTNI